MNEGYENMFWEIEHCEAQFDFVLVLLVLVMMI